MEVDITPELGRGEPRIDKVRLFRMSDDSREKKIAGDDEGKASEEKTVAFRDDAIRVSEAVACSILVLLEDTKADE